MSEKPTKRAPRWSWIAGAILLTAAVAAGGAWLHHASQPQRFESPPISQELSGEAREGCVSLGMSAEEIDADQDACLTSYWTYERLLRSERTLVDWYADNDMVKPCQVGLDGSKICQEVGGQPGGLPRQNHPWWNEQATRDPGRTSVPEGQDMSELRDW